MTPGKRGKGAKPEVFEEGQEKTPAEGRAAMTPDQVRGRLWAQRIIACIEDPAVIKKILTHLDTKDASAAPVRLPPARAPPQDN